jgi:hypothetical protein
MAAGLLLWSAAAPAQDAITIKLKRSEQGSVTLVNKSETTTSKVKVEDAQGNAIVDKVENKVVHAAYTETILERDGIKPPTKLERAYTKCQVKDGDETEDLGLAGKTVVIEKKDDKYTFAFKGGGEVTGAAATLLSKELSNKRETNADLEKLLLPKGAVKAGGTWKLDMEPILNDLFKKGGELEFHTAKATGTGKLVKAYKKDGRQFGEIRYQLTMPLKTIGKVPTQMTFNDGAKMSMEITMDVCIDGTSEAGAMNMRASLVGTATSGDTTVRLDILSVTTGTQAEPAKK